LPIATNVSSVIAKKPPIARTGLAYVAISAFAPTSH
jgi:hypothetical protein